MRWRAAGPVELARLRGWLRAEKGRLTFESLARRACARGMQVSACTLRRALDGRLPTLYTVRAFARGAGADDKQAQRMWAAAAAAVHPERAHKPAAYIPEHRITTREQLVAAMEKIRAAAGGPSLRRLAGSSRAAGRISRSALHNALTGRRLPSEDLLAGFAAACGAGEEVARALLAARARILAAPRPRLQAGPAARYPCEIAEEYETRRVQDAAVRHWIKDEDELDGYDRQLRDAQEAEQERTTAWVDDLTDDELEKLQQPRHLAGAERDLRAELGAHIPR